MVNQAGPAFQNLFQELNDICHKNLELAVAGTHVQDIAELHASAAVLSDWATALNPRLEALLVANAEKEFQLSAFSLLQGNHRHAFRGLRLAMELVLQAVQLSLNYLALVEWMAGKQDTIWAAIVDRDNGVFSRRVVSILWPVMEQDAESKCETAKEVYRKCSAYVHGNLSVANAERPVICFSPEVVDEWSGLARRALDVMQFALTTRFLRDIDPVPSRLHTVLEDQFGHLQGVRDYLGREHSPSEE